MSGRGRVVTVGNRWHLIGPVSGILAAFLYVVSRTFGGWHIPGTLDLRPEHSVDIVGPAFVENADGFRIGAHLGFLSALFLLVFIADLRRRMAEREGASGTWGTLAFAGGLLLAGVMVMQNSLSLAARVIGNNDMDPALAQTIIALQWSGSDLMAAPIAAIVLSVSLMSLLTEFLPRLFAWFGVVLTVGVVVTLAVPTDSPLFIFTGLSLLWMAMVAAILLVQDLLPSARSDQVAAPVS